MSLDLFVDIDLGRESTHFFELGTVNNDFLTVDVVVVLLLQSLGNLVAGDGTKKMAIFTNLGNQADNFLVDSSLQSFGILAEFLFFESALADVLSVDFACWRIRS